MAKLNDARRSLERAKESALGRLKQIEEERREIKSSVKSLNAALKALGNTKSSGGTENSDTSEEDVAATPPAQKSNNVNSKILSEERGDDGGTSEH